MKKIDMHMHTCASDGTWDVNELKEELIKNHINIFSITDHDSIDNIKNMQQILKPSDNLQFIPGTELTCEYEGREYHLTVYNFDAENKLFLDLIKWTIDNKLNTNKNYIKYVSDNYDSISLEDYEKYEYDRKKGGWKSANYLIEKGIHTDFITHLNEMAKSGIKASFKSPEEIINVAKKSGGYVFLAHPSYNYRNSKMPVEELKFWLEAGIDGVECYSPYNKGEEQYYIDFCRKNNLMISGGSDCHGLFIPSRKLGLPEVMLEDLHINKILK